MSLFKIIKNKNNYDISTTLGGGVLSFNGSKLLTIDDIEIGTIILQYNKESSPAEKYGGIWELLPEGYALETFVYKEYVGADEQFHHNFIEGEGNDFDKNVYWNSYRKRKAGLPDIKGQLVNTLHVDGLSSTGVFKDSTVSGTTRQYRLGESYVFRIGSTFDFKASNYNTIYGNSTTVQPKAIRIFAWRKISG